MTRALKIMQSKKVGTWNIKRHVFLLSDFSVILKCKHKYKYVTNKNIS